MLIDLNDKLTILGHGTTPVFDLHPLQLTAWIESVWETWRVLGNTASNVSRSSPTAVIPGLGQVLLLDDGDVGVRDGSSSSPGLVGPLKATFFPPLQQVFNTIDPETTIGGKKIGQNVEIAAINALNGLLDNGSPPAKPVPPLWLHLVYGYLIENTRIVDIARRILQEALYDESFGPLSEASHRWLRVTEDFFFRDGTSSLIQSITSWVRPDHGATRRNAYYRMFGMDLNHGRAEGGEYAYTKATSANGEFVRIFQELLREVWKGFINANNDSGPNTTDEAGIFELLNRLKVMMNSRRQSAPDAAERDARHANLAREELVIVTMMSWFDLTVRTNTPIVNDLRASADSPEDRLRKLGERVKLPAHSKSRSFFFLARDLPGLLRLIEEGTFDDSANVPLLFKAAASGETALRDSVLRIINHWSLATGIDLKSVSTAPGPR